MAGTAIAARAHGVRAYGAEPLAVDDAARSMQTGVRQPSVVSPNTIGDGLLTGLGELNFAVMIEHGVEVVTVTEEAMMLAALDHLERMKILVEPSGATSLAAIRARRDDWHGLRIGAVISGGNTDLSWLSAAHAAQKSSPSTS